MSINNNIPDSALPLPMPMPMPYKSTRSGATGKSLGTKSVLELPIARVPSDYGLSSADVLLQIHRRRGRSASLGSARDESKKMKRQEREFVQLLAVAARKFPRAA
jgi:hypothetical protein